MFTPGMIIKNVLMDKDFDKIDGISHIRENMTSKAGCGSCMPKKIKEEIEQLIQKNPEFKNMFFDKLKTGEIEYFQNTKNGRELIKIQKELKEPKFDLVEEYGANKQIKRYVQSKSN